MRRLGLQKTKTGNFFDLISTCGYEGQLVFNYRLIGYSRNSSVNILDCNSLPMVLAGPCPE
jgi:hypothetical protein